MLTCTREDHPHLPRRRRRRAWASTRTETTPYHASYRIATHMRMWPGVRFCCGHPRRSRHERNLGAVITTENSLKSTSGGALKSETGGGFRGRSLFGARRRHRVVHSSIRWRFRTRRRRARRLRLARYAACWRRQGLTPQAPSPCFWRVWKRCECFSNLDLVGTIERDTARRRRSIDHHPRRPTEYLLAQPDP